jgi:hypothetical protein
MSKKIIWGVVIAVIIIAGAAVYGLSIKPCSPNCFGKSQLSEIKDWKTYTDTKYGFEFKYPADWNVKDYPNSNIGDISVAVQSPERQKYFIGNPDGSLPISEIAISIHPIGYRKVNSKQTVFNNLKAFETTYTAEDTFNSITLDKGQYTYEIIAELTKSSTIESNILSTFKLTEPVTKVDTSSWKTYRNEKYGFKFKYPGNWTIENSNPRKNATEDNWYKPERFPFSTVLVRPNYKTGDIFDVSVNDGELGQEIKYCNISSVIFEGRKAVKYVCAEGGEGEETYTLELRKGKLISISLRTSMASDTTDNIPVSIVTSFFDSFEFFPITDFSDEPVYYPQSKPLVKVTTTGGMCVYVACGAVTTVDTLGNLIRKDGSGKESIKKIDFTEISDLRSLVEGTNYEGMRRFPFTGTCPTAYDGTQYIYEFYVHGKVEILDMCKTNINYDDPLFVSLMKILQ